VLNWLYRISDRLRQRREAQSLSPDTALGRRGEDIAHRYLQRHGYSICARNWRSTGGYELDLVARKRDLLVFVEVKTRSSTEHGAPDRAIDREKQIHIARAAAQYTRAAKADWSLVRFDVVSVVVHPGRAPEVEHFQDTFRPDVQPVR
jgi:putative endonuclease